MFLKMCKIQFIFFFIRPIWEGGGSLSPDIICVQELQVNTHNVVEKLLTIYAPQKYDIVAWNSTWYLAESAIHSFIHLFKYSTYNFVQLLSAKQKLLLMAPMRNILSYSWNKVPSRREIHISCTTETCIQCSIIIFSTPSKWSSSLWLKPSKKPSRQILRCRSVP